MKNEAGLKTRLKEEEEDDEEEEEEEELRKAQ